MRGGKGSGGISVLCCGAAQIECYEATYEGSYVGSAAGRRRPPPARGRLDLACVTAAAVLRFACSSLLLKMETPTASCPEVAAAAAAVSVSQDDAEIPGTSNDPILFTIKFQPGPLGMNLKPVRSEAIDEDEGSGPPGKNEFGCQIMNFVENSATKRSQARDRSLRHGDIVTRVGDADVTTTPFHVIVDLLKRKDVDDKGIAVGKSITFKRLPKKRGRPVGSKNKARRNAR